MNCETNQWYVRWFRWSCQVLDRSLPKIEYERTDRYSRGTNLCHFFQTIWWGTLLAVISASMWIYVLAVTLWLPLYLFPLSSVMTTVGLTVIVVAAFVALLCAIVCFPDAVQFLRRRAQSATKQIDGSPPSFVQVCVTYVKSIKQRFCPTITFKDNNNGQA